MEAAAEDGATVSGEDDVVALYPAAHELPIRPPPAYECNFTHYFALDVGGKQYHDQYVYRHANGLCVIGLAPTHAAFQPSPAVTAVDYNVGKQSRVEMKASGKRKKDARILEENSVLCKVITEDDAFFIVRCCIRGQLLEVNERLINDPSILNTKAATEGHIAIMMPRPEGWTKAEKSLLTRDQYRQKRSIL